MGGAVNEAVAIFLQNGRHTGQSRPGVAGHVVTPECGCVVPAGGVNADAIGTEHAAVFDRAGSRSLGGPRHRVRVVVPEGGGVIAAEGEEAQIRHHRSWQGRAGGAEIPGDRAVAVRATLTRADKGGARGHAVRDGETTEEVAARIGRRDGVGDLISGHGGGAVHGLRQQTRESEVISGAGLPRGDGDGEQFTADGEAGRHLGGGGITLEQVITRTEAVEGERTARVGALCADQLIRVRVVVAIPVGVQVHGKIGDRDLAHVHHTIDIGIEEGLA